MKKIVVVEDDRNMCTELVQLLKNSGYEAESLKEFEHAEGATELIKNNENGFLISYRNKEEYAKKVLELIHNKKERVRLGKCGRETSLNYTSEKIQKEWMKVLKRK